MPYTESTQEQDILNKAIGILQASQLPLNPTSIGGQKITIITNAFHINDGIKDDVKAKMLELLEGKNISNTEISFIPTPMEYYYVSLSIQADQYDAFKGINFSEQLQGSSATPPSTLTISNDPRQNEKSYNGPCR